ncbi:MAG: hypothetical protein AAGF49_01725 [Pseudomonadota bacterium]
MRAIRLAHDDDVAVVVGPARVGDLVAVMGTGEAATLSAREALPQHHKVALTALPVGHKVRRAGVVIGALNAPVEAGDLVHVHNLQSLRGGG